MKVRFFRRRFVTAIVPSGSGLSRAFELSLGLEAPVNAESGMTVNLTHVDEWLAKIPQDASYNSEVEALADFRRRLTEMIGVAAKFISVELKEDRQWWTDGERGLEIGRREASRKMIEGRSLPIWLETVVASDGRVIETREVAFDGLVTRTIS